MAKPVFEPKQLVFVKLILLILGPELFDIVAASISIQLFASIILTKTAGAKSKKLGSCIKTDGGTDPTIVSTSSQYDSVTSQT